MFTVIYTKNNITEGKNFDQYFQALTFGINLQNNGYTVEIITGKEKLYSVIAKLDSALKILKQDMDYWHTQRELDEIMKSMNEIENFKFQLIKEYNL